MDKEIDIEFLDKLRAFRREPALLEALQNWIKKNKTEVEKTISPGVALKLRSKDIQKVMSGMVSIVPTCIRCEKISRPKIFSSRQEHRFVASQVETALLTGVLRRIKSPSWFHSNGSQYGADAYFECTSCGSIWTLVEPEHEDHGQWVRIA